MKRTINGYPYNLPKVEDVRESRPGFWEGLTKKGEPFWIIGGSRIAHGARRQWQLLFPAGLKTIEGQPKASLADALREVNALA